MLSSFTIECAGQPGHAIVSDLKLWKERECPAVAHAEDDSIDIWDTTTTTFNEHGSAFYTRYRWVPLSLRVVGCFFAKVSIGRMTNCDNVHGGSGCCGEVKCDISSRN